MRGTREVGILFIIFFLTSLTYGEILENLIKTNIKDDIIITKACVVESQDIINPNTGAKTTVFETILSIKIKNTKTIKQQLILEQDNSFIPNSIQVRFNLKPTSVEGNYYRWDLGLMEVEQEREINMYVRTKIECERFLRDYSTSINYTGIPTKLYEIEGKKTAQKGERINITLKNIDGTLAINVAVVIKKPSGQKVQYYTNKDGVLTFLADEEGAYFVESIGQQTRLEHLITVYPKSIEDQSTPKPPQAEKSQEIDLSIIYTIAGILITLGAIGGAYYIYKKIVEKKEEEEVYVPTASAQKSDEEYKIELEKETEAKIEQMQENKGYEHSDKKVEKGEEELENEEELLALTSSLIEKRRKLSLEKQKIEDLASTGLQTKKQEEREEEEEQTKQIDLEKEEEEIEEIDEEAIKKTIEELEQLRQELKRRQYEQQMPPETAINYEEIDKKKIEQKERKSTKKTEKRAKKEEDKTAKSDEKGKKELDEIEKTLQSIIKEEEKEESKPKRKIKKEKGKTNKKK